MRKIIPLFLVLLLYANNLFCQEQELIWSDEFNNGTLDESKWSYETGTGVNGDWGTGQLDRATDRLENVSFQDNVTDADGGCLVITTRKEEYFDRSYTSGRIFTKDKASWGPGHRIVARVKPQDVRYKGQGFAFWMMPQEKPANLDYIMWPQGGEIDIMEYVGSIPYHNLGTVHYAWFWENNEYRDWNHGHKGGYYSYETQQVPNPEEPGYGNYPPPVAATYAGSTDFHTYGIDWYNDRIEFFIDDNVYHIHYLADGGAFSVDGEDQSTVKDIDGRRVFVSEYSNHFNEWYPFEHKMYAILSAGVGGSQYTYGGAIVPEAEFPCSVFVDWVRVYKHEGTTTSTEKKIETGENSKRIKMFPNPVHNKLNLELEKNMNYALSIKDLSGKTLINIHVKGSKEIDMSGLKDGAYLVTLSNNKLITSQMIIKKEQN